MLLGVASDSRFPAHACPEMHGCFTPSAGASGSVPSRQLPASPRGPAGLGAPAPHLPQGHRQPGQAVPLVHEAPNDKQAGTEKTQHAQPSGGVYPGVGKVVQVAFYFRSLQGHLRISQGLAVTGGSVACLGTAQSTPSQSGHRWRTRSPSPQSTACAARCHTSPQHRNPAG